MSFINSQLGSVQGKPSYETYIETWDSTTMAAIEALANKTTPPSLEGVSINLAFASFGKNPPNAEISFANLSQSQLKELLDKVHQYGGEVKISFGGAAHIDPAGYQMWLSDYLKDRNDVSTLASSITSFLQNYGFDGIDFDIEDRGVAADFPDLAAALIKEIRQKLPNTDLTLTVPGQPWGQYWVELIQKSVADVDHVNFMEYDIWIDTTGQGTGGPKTYSTQIQWDINYYISNLGIPPHKIELGLMPGFDDIGNKLTVSDAVALAKWAQSIGLAGVMTWDLNRDYAGLEGAGSEAYSAGIMEALTAQSKSDRYNVEKPLKGKRGAKTYRTDSAPEDNKLDPTKLPKSKPSGLFDITPRKNI